MLQMYKNRKIFITTTHNKFNNASMLFDSEAIRITGGTMSSPEDDGIIAEFFR